MEFDPQTGVPKGLGEALARALQSPWQPACVARAFASGPSRLWFTMQRWIDLEAIRSPLLLGEIPAMDELDAALQVFGETIDGKTPAEAVQLAELVLREIREGFAMAVKVTPPEAGGELGVDESGIGDWLALYACLVTQCRLSHAEVMRMKVGAAYALLVGHRVNRGWRVAGIGYAQRDAVTAFESTSAEGEEATNG